MALKKLGELKPASWNPRKIGDQERMALTASIKEFGDLSGIVVNADGTLISGHQRVSTLKEEYGEEISIDGDFMTLPDGKQIRVRQVDWDDATSKAAAIAANNQAMQGKFTLDVFDLIEEVEDMRPDLADRMALRYVEVDGADEDEEEDNSANNKDENMVPKMELQPYEHYDYVLVLARSTSDWYRLCHLLEIEKVDSSPIAGKKKIGLGRAIDAGRVLKMLEGADAVPKEEVAEAPEE